MAASESTGTYYPKQHMSRSGQTQSLTNGSMVATEQGLIMYKLSDGLLLIEGELADAARIMDALSNSGQPHIEWVTNLAEGLHRLKQRGVAAILLNLFLPDSRGIDTFDKTLAAAGNIPILVMCCANNESIGSLAVEHGAHDFLLKDHLDKYSLTRAVTSMIERRKTADVLFMEKERAEVTLNSIGDAVLSTDIEGNVTYLNLVAECMTGWSKAVALGRPLAEVFNIIDGTTRERSDNPMSLAVRENKTVSLTANCILIRRDGYEAPIEDSAAPIHDRIGHITGAVIVFRDVSVARRMSLQLSHLAQHDSLTDLPNRMLLNDRLQQAISMARRHDSRIAVLFMDLDRFKHINDSLGHIVGDQLLQAVATRLERCVRESDTVGRQGGDEFVAVLSELDAAENAGISAAKLLAALALPYHIGPHDVIVPVSIGVSIYPEDGETAEALISNADTAMYHAKENGRNNYQFFKQEMNVRASERQFIEAGLRVALERNELSLHYQPKINLGTGAIVGVEALLRWKHPERGFIPPAQFIPIAEDTGLILPIGQWVLREACRQSREWLDAGFAPIPMAVNISAVEFRSMDFVESVRAALNESKLDPRFLELELTETVLMKHAASTVSMLKALKVIGVQLTVDDFGTGYSSLSYLRQFPVDSLKVDQSFVHEISSQRDDAAIVSAVISMGNSLKKRVIAEGVETREQMDFLTAEGCEEAQGYYFNRPMAANQFVKLLEASISHMIPN
jgi:diguanylate cyclase (GGDEF)-like protein/PAS domain S-box-containing protein